MAATDEARGKELKVSPPIYRLGGPGRWVRAQLQAGILGGTPVLVRLQTFRSPLRNDAMKLISFLGEEEFYTPLVAGLVWLVDARLGRLLALLMALGFYLTGVLKNLLCLPRPPSPPVVPLERCNDWGLPSHHALLGVNVPWYIWFHVCRHHALGPAPLGLLFSLIALWSFFVMASRMYLGVHSPADVLTGGIVGCVLLAFWLRVDTAVDMYVAASPGAPLLALALALALLGLHPDPPPTTAIYAETVCMVGVATGFVVGRAWASPAVLSAVGDALAGYQSWQTVAVCCALRLVVGLALLLVLKTAVAVGSRWCLRYGARLAGVPTSYVKRVSSVSSERVHYSHHFQVLEEPPSSSGKPQRWSTEHPLNLDIPVKFLSYIAMGAAAVAIAPYSFNLMGI